MPNQLDWRFCKQCNSLFFNGFPTKGRCPAGRSHRAQGHNFSLPHDIPVAGSAQADWRFCHKCHAMFFDGFPTTGHCPAGGGHAAAGFNFVLRFQGNLEHDVELNPVSD